MSKNKQKKDLNVDLIGGETLTETEKEQLKTFFQDQKEKRKKRTKRAESKKKNVAH